MISAFAPLWRERWGKHDLHIASDHLVLIYSYQRILEPLAVNIFVLSATSQQVNSLWILVNYIALHTIWKDSCFDKRKIIYKLQTLGIKLIMIFLIKWWQNIHLLLIFHSDAKLSSSMSLFSMRNSLQSSMLFAPSFL